MFIVLVSNNFDDTKEAYVFNDAEKASDYLRKIWENRYNDEIAAGSAIVEDECYHDECEDHECDFAKIEFETGEQIWFSIIKSSDPECDSNDD